MAGAVDISRYNTINTLDRLTAGSRGALSKDSKRIIHSLHERKVVREHRRVAHRK